MLVLSRAEVESILDLDQLVDALAQAMADLSAGRASVPARVAATVADRDGLLAAMPAFLPSAGVLSTKLVSLFPGNRDRPTHQAIVCCFDPDNGTPLALMDGTYLTAARTAAGSALATRLLARSDAAVVGIIGSGVQARSHARALARLPGVKLLRVASRDERAARVVVDELLADGLPAEVAPSIADAVGSADIVCATTHAAEPVVRRSWLRPGTHVNTVGYNPAGEGEVDTATFRDAVVVVESRETALAPPPAGAVEFHKAGADVVHAELGELVEGTVVGRTDDSQLTLYKSVGVAVQDAAAAGLVVRAALERGVGRVVEI